MQTLTLKDLRRVAGMIELVLVSIWSALFRCLTPKNGRLGHSLAFGGPTPRVLLARKFLRVQVGTSPPRDGDQSQALAPAGAKRKDGDQSSRI